MNDISVEENFTSNSCIGNFLWIISTSSLRGFPFAKCLVDSIISPQTLFRFIILKMITNLRAFIKIMRSFRAFSQLSPEAIRFVALIKFNDKQICVRFKLVNSKIHTQSAN